MVDREDVGLATPKTGRTGPSIATRSKLHKTDKSGENKVFDFRVTFGDYELPVRSVFISDVELRQLRRPPSRRNQRSGKVPAGPGRSAARDEPPFFATWKCAANWRSCVATSYGGRVNHLDRPFPTGPVESGRAFYHSRTDRRDSSYSLAATRHRTSMNATDVKYIKLS